MVRAGSLTQAAEVLCVTQPAVSRRIRFLEEQYGQPLLDRSGPQVRPTEAGRLVVKKAEALLEIEAELEAGLHRLVGKTRLSFGSTQAFGIAHLPKIIKEFMLVSGDTAELKFMFLNPNELLQSMGEGLFDVAVLEGAAILDASFTAVPLPDAEIAFFSAPALGIPSPQTTIDTLIEQPLFTRREGCCSRILLERGLKGLGLDLGAFKQAIILDDLHLLIQTVLDGAGVGFLPMDLLVDHLDSGRAKLHMLPGFQHTRQRSLAIAQFDDPSGPLAQLLAIISQHFQLAPGRIQEFRSQVPAESASSGSPFRPVQNSGRACFALSADPKLS